LGALGAYTYLAGIGESPGVPGGTSDKTRVVVSQQNNISRS